MAAGTYASAVALIAASLLVGTALGTIGRRAVPSWPDAGVGLAALLVLANVGVRLPGHATTAAGLAGLAVVLAVARLAPRRRELRRAAAGLPVAAVVLLAASLPFLVSGRVGTLGPGVLNDMGFHLVWAEALGDGDLGAVNQPGYPVGPHALVATAAHALGTDVDAAFLGLLLAVPVLTALIALPALRGLPRARRVVAAVLVGLPYLAAAYLAQAAFKETVLALLLLAFVLTLAEVERAPRAAAGLPLGLLAAGIVVTFSLSGAAWPAAAAGCLVVALLGTDRRRARDLARGLGPPLGLGALVAAVLLAPEAARLVDFATSETGGLASGNGGPDADNPGGNYVAKLARAEVVGVWPSPDFRQSPPGGGALRLAVTAFGVALVAFAAWRWIRLGRLAVPAALAGGLVLHEVSRAVSLPYVSGKALVVIAPLVMLLVVAVLFAEGPRRRTAAAVWGLVLALFAGGAAASSALALRSAAVRDREQARDLARLRPLVAGQRVLFLGRDEFAEWELRGARVVGLAGNRSKEIALVRPEKQVPGPDGPYDLDAVGPETLDAVRFVVAPRTGFGSAPPAALRLVRRGRWYTLWERAAAVGERQVLAEGEAPGRTLDCRDALPDGRGGRAAVRPAPLVRPTAAWRRADGGRLRRVGEYAVVLDGETVGQTLRLPRGRWDVALVWTGAATVRVGPGPATDLPVNLTDPTALWTVAEVVAGPAGAAVDVELHVPRARVDVARQGLVGALAATRLDRPARAVPLGRACGRYVDWYVAGTRSAPR